MSVVHSTPSGWWLDHENSGSFLYTINPALHCALPTTMISKAVAAAAAKRRLSSSCVENAYDESRSSHLVFRFSTKFFRIESPFLTDTQFDARVRRQKTASAVRLKSRKRKIIAADNPLELRHEEIDYFLKTAMDEILRSRAKDLFVRPSTEEMASNNNVEARMMAASLHRHSLLMDKLNCRANVSANRSLLILTISGSVGVRGSVANILVTHTGSCGGDCKSGSEEPCYLQLGDDHDHFYLVPPRCSFLMSDVALLRKFVDSVKPFDLIVMDPPWYNKSVKRKKRYRMMENHQIKEIPLRRLASDGALVAIWTPNNDTCLTFVRDELFPTWGLEFVAEWHWLKFTTRGETICDLESKHKKPYEHVIIGVRRSGTGGAAPRLMPRNHRVICSVPSSLHSHKPPLHELLAPYVREDGRCLELFSRYLLPGWTSWGNETLLLQHTDFYDVFFE